MATFNDSVWCERMTILNYWNCQRCAWKQWLAWFHGSMKTCGSETANIRERSSPDSRRRALTISAEVKYSKISRIISIGKSLNVVIDVLSLSKERRKRNLFCPIVKVTVTARNTSRSSGDIYRIGRMENSRDETGVRPI